MGQPRVILADRNSNALGGIRRLLETEVETVLMVGDEGSLCHALQNVPHDLVVADLSLPVSTETNVAWMLKKKFPQTRVIILSMHDDESVAEDVMAAGVEGFVLKRRAVIDLIPSIHEVLHGRTYISKEGSSDGC